MPSTENKPITVFLSYSRKDQAACNDIYANLELQGLDVKIDLNDIAPGENLKDTITQLISNTAYSIVIVSENSIQSAWVIWEFQRRVGLEQFRVNSKLIPVYLDKSYLDDNYVNNILSNIQADIDQLVIEAAKLNHEGSPSNHLDTKKQSLFDFKNNFSKVIDQIRSTNAVDLRAENYIHGFNALYQAITGSTRLNCLDIKTPLIKNADIKLRRDEIERLLADADMKEAANRTIDFVEDFHQNNMSFRKTAIRISAKVNNTEKNLPKGIELVDSYDKLVEEILDLIYTPYANAA